MLVNRPAISPSSQRRALAIAASSRARASARMGRRSDPSAGAKQAPQGSDRGASPRGVAAVRPEISPQRDVRDAAEGPDHVREEPDRPRRIPLAGLMRATKLN